MNKRKITDAQVKGWYELWIAGKKTALEIANDEGRSRNSVIGAIDRYRKRHNLPNKGMPNGNHAWLKSTPENRRPAYKSETAPFQPTITISGPEEWAAGKCRYIDGDPKAGNAVYCGHDAQPGSSYCPGHHAHCWKKPPKQKDCVE